LPCLLEQHNVHHARTNEVGIDEDIATDPALFLWAPDPKNDAPWRKYQGAYLPLPMSMLFLVSPEPAVKRRASCLLVPCQIRVVDEWERLGISWASLASGLYKGSQVDTRERDAVAKAAGVGLLAWGCWHGAWGGFWQAGVPLFAGSLESSPACLVGVLTR
jgi:hypothetical protein